MPNNRSRGKHGLTIDEARTFREGKVCAICGIEPPEASDGRDPRHIDHCHVNNHVRDVLCSNCNRALGLMADDPERLEAAAAYLRKHCTPCR